MDEKILNERLRGGLPEGDKGKRFDLQMRNKKKKNNTQATFPFLPVWAGSS